MALDRFHGCGVSCGITSIVQEVASSSDTCPIWFIFFWSVIDGVPGVCDFLTVGDFTSVDPIKDIHSFYIFVALEKTCKFIDARSIPSVDDVGIWVLDEFVP